MDISIQQKSQSIKIFIQTRMYLIRINKTNQTKNLQLVT